MIKKSEELAKQRKIDEKIKEESKKTEELEKQEQCVIKMLSIREYEQSRLANELLKEEEVQTEKTELEKAEDEIIKKVLQNEDKLNESDQKIIADEKAKQNRIKNNLVQLTLDQEKDLPGVEVCYDDKLVDNLEEGMRTTCGGFIPKASESDMPNI